MHVQPYFPVAHEHKKCFTGTATCCDEAIDGNGVDLQILCRKLFFALKPLIVVNNIEQHLDAPRTTVVIEFICKEIGCAAIYTVCPFKPVPPIDKTKLPSYAIKQFENAISFSLVGDLGSCRINDRFGHRLQHHRWDLATPQLFQASRSIWFTAAARFDKQTIAGLFVTGICCARFL